MEDYGNVGLSWQKDASWGSYHVTTLHAYEPVILENALIYSDNIYFAKAALKIAHQTLLTVLVEVFHHHGTDGRNIHRFIVHTLEDYQLGIV